MTDGGCYGLRQVRPAAYIVLGKPPPKASAAQPRRPPVQEDFGEDYGPAVGPALPVKKTAPVASPTAGFGGGDSGDEIYEEWDSQEEEEEGTSCVVRRVSYVVCAGQTH